MAVAGGRRSICAANYICYPPQQRNWTTPHSRVVNHAYCLPAYTLRSLPCRVDLIQFAAHRFSTLRQCSPSPPGVVRATPRPALPRLYDCLARTSPRLTRGCRRCRERRLPATMPNAVLDTARIVYWDNRRLDLAGSLFVCLPYCSTTGEDAFGAPGRPCGAAGTFSRFVTSCY